MKTLALIIAILFASVAQANDPVSIDTGLRVLVFGQKGCMPCRIYAPTVQVFKQQNPDAKVIHIDVIQNPDLMKEYEITHLPSTLILFDGEPQFKAVGAINIRQLTSAFTRVLDQFGNPEEEEEEEEQPVEPDTKPKKPPKYFFGWSPLSHLLVSNEPRRSQRPLHP